MRHNNHYYPKLVSVLVCLITVFTSCKKSAADDLFMVDYTQMDKEKIARYVTSEPDSIKRIIDLATTQSTITSVIGLENVGLDNQELNSQIYHQFGRKATAAAEFISSYAITITTNADAVNSRFVWQDMAKYLLSQYYGMEELPNDSAAAFFEDYAQICNHLLQDTTKTHQDAVLYYARIVPEYLLIESLKNLYDQCDTEALKMPMLKAFYATLQKCSQQSDAVEKEASDYFLQLYNIHGRTKSEARMRVETIRTRYAKGSMDLESVLSELDEMSKY